MQWEGIVYSAFGGRGPRPVPATSTAPAPTPAQRPWCQAFPQAGSEGRPPSVRRGRSGVPRWQLQVAVDLFIYQGLCRAPSP